MMDDLLTAFPALATLDIASLAVLREGMRAITLPPGTTLFADGSACHAFLFLLGGSVRVQKVAETGREIVLYRVEPGQTCVLTTNCLLAQAPYGAEGVAETEVRGYALTPSVFQQLLGRSQEFRTFVFSAYATRIADLLMLIEEVAFGRIDVRLAHLLLARAEGGVIQATHQDLATDLGSAREVISRQLKDFERRGWLTLARGRIHIIDHPALAHLSGRSAGEERG